MALVTYNSTLTEYENIVRTKLKVVNPTLIKSGALGILTNYLAGIKYDAFQLYTKAFQEMNVGLAQDFNSMLYHSSIFNAELGFAKPSTLTSSLVLPEIRLAEVEEVIYTIPRFTTFVDNNDLNFTFISEIKLTINNKGMKGVAWNPETGNTNLSITKAPNPNIPGSNVYLIYNNDAQQYTRTFQDFIVTQHNVGETFQFSIGISNVNKLKETHVWINSGVHLTGVELQSLSGLDQVDIEGSFASKGANITKMNIKYYKFDSSLSDQDIFLEILDSSLNFETGDGLHGALQQPGHQIIVEIQETEGIQGNISNSEYIVSNANVQEKYSNGYIKTPSPTTINGLSTIGSHGGTNAQSVDEIRGAIFDKLNTRGSIITENDYERYFKYQGNVPFVDAKFIDAKAFVFLFNTIHDNDNVVASTSINLKEEILITDPFYPLYSYNGINLISPFYYKYHDENTISAYIVDPKLVFSLTETSNILDQNADYRVDIGLTYEFQRTQTSMTGTSYIQVIGNTTTGYMYEFECSWLNGAVIQLHSGNDFKQQVDAIYTDDFCIVHDRTYDIKVRVYNEITNSSNQYNSTPIAEYIDSGTYHQLIKKQEFYKYFRPAKDNIVDLTNANNGYLDNYLENLFTQADAVFANAISTNTEMYILRLPFIDENWFLGKSPSEIFGVLDSYFIMDQNAKLINYNTQLIQSFHNTIDIPEKYYPWVFEKTTMPVINTPKISIDLEIFINKDQFITSAYKTTTDLEIAIKIECIKYMKGKEGFQIEFFETELEKLLYNKFSPLVINSKVLSPTLFQVNSSGTIYNNIQENLSFDDLLDFIPPYFYYDYDVNLSIVM
jgi:hypothetical protein